MSYKENYLYWKNHPDLDPELRKELEAMSETQIEDAFFKDVKFETAGMRGLMGVGSNRLNIHTVRKATQGLADYLHKYCGGEGKVPSVAIGYDNRYHSQEFAFDCAKLLAGNGVKAYVFENLCPTPELSYAVRYYHCDGGIMITASHNPKEYNGYKVYDEQGCQLIPVLADRLIKEIDKIEDGIAVKPAADYDPSLLVVVGDKVTDNYIKDVLSIRINPDEPKDFTIAFSPEHGTSYLPVMRALKEAGYTAYVVDSQKDPDPAFSNTKTPNPEDLRAYEGVLELGKEINADLLLVCDPDGDRMGVGIKHNGEFIVLNGNKTGALLLEYILSTKKEIPANACMFNTIVTSDLGEAVARSYGVDVEKTLTGFKYIGDKYHKYEYTHEKEYIFGYEESYGSLIAPFVRDKDATQACLMLAEACAYYRNRGKDLVDVLNDVYAKVGSYFDVQVSVLLPGADGAVKLKAIMENLRKHPLEVPGYDIVKVEDYKAQTVTENGKVEPFAEYDVTDVLKYYLSDGSYLAIRPSGTEPKCKVYICAKADSMEKAEAKAEEFKKVSRAALGE
ncbi:MAG: phospho-sugar mutase [Erysipelotrichaceae bacterium]|nr:phospho-sugar mutase [Erysipelotrichaceae bacterium]